MSNSTSIRIGRSTLERLNDRKQDAETHDELLQRLLAERNDEN